MRIQSHIVTLSIRITKPFIQQVTPSSLFLNNCQISSFFISKSAKYRQKSPRKSNFWRHKNSSTDVAWPCFAHFLRISFLTFRFMVTIMSMCFMSFWLLIAHFHCPITSSVTSIINQNGQLYLQLVILVLFVSMFLQTPATVHFFFIINAIFLHHASILQA